MCVNISIKKLLFLMSHVQVRKIKPKSKGGRGFDVLFSA